MMTCTPSRRGSVKRRSIMDYGGEDEGAGGGGGGGMWSLTGEQTDIEFLHQQQLEALIPLKEDLSDWLNKLLGIEIDEEMFMDVLDSGVHVCKLAKLIQKNAEEAVAEGRVLQKLTKSKLKFKENARSGTWFARDNIANFIRWCREYKIKEEYMFETEGLVTHSEERNFVLCLLELGRLAYTYGMEAPTLVVMEKEIDGLEQDSCFGDETIPYETESNGHQRESRLPLRRASISVMTDGSYSENNSIGTLTEVLRERSKSRSKSRSPDTRRRSITAGNDAMTPLYIDTHNLSPNPRRSPSPKRSLTPRSGASPKSGIPSPRSGIPTSRRTPSPRASSIPRASPSPRPLSDATTETGTNSGSPQSKRKSTASSGTDMSDFHGKVSPRSSRSSTGTGTDTSDFHGHISPRPRSSAYSGTEARDFSGQTSLRPRSSTGTGMDMRDFSGQVSLRPRSSTCCGTDMGDINDQVSPHGRTFTSTGSDNHKWTFSTGQNGHGTSIKSDTSMNSQSISVGIGMTNTEANASTGNVYSTVDGACPNGATTGTSSPRSVWRRSSSPHTKIPVPSGTSAHGTLSRGVSSSSINSVGTPVNGNTPKARRRFSTSGTPNLRLSGETPRGITIGTKTPRRRSMSNKSDKSDELDKEVQEPPRKKVRRISGRCQCPQCYQIDRLSEGKYRIGERVVFVRLLKGKHVMVRVGGGWDTLDHYLATHDPCRVMEVRRDPSSHSLTHEDDKFLFIHGKYKGGGSIS